MNSIGAMAEGPPDVSYVRCELVRSSNRRRLVHRLGAADIATSRRVADIMRTLLRHTPA